MSFSLSPPLFRSLFCFPSLSPSFFFISFFVSVFFPSVSLFFSFSHSLSPFPFPLFCFFSLSFSFPLLFSLSCSLSFSLFSSFSPPPSFSLCLCFQSHPLRLGFIEGHLPSLSRFPALSTPGNFSPGRNEEGESLLP